MSELDERSALAALMFPQQWAAVAQLPGASKRRQQLRKRAEHAVALQALRGAGARCLTCRAFRRDPMFPGHGTWCDTHSDFHGYQAATGDDLCLSYREAEGGER